MNKIKKYILLSGVLLGMSANAQSVGITNQQEPVPTGYAFPAESASLDVLFAKKGITLPKYNLTVLNDPENPVNLKQDMALDRNVNGTMIFNEGGAGNTNARGYYLWVRDRWHLVIRKGEEPQQMSVMIPTQTVVLEANVAKRPLSGLELVDTSIEGAAVVGGNKITLPAGKYVYKYLVDLNTTGADTGHVFPGSTGVYNYNLCAVSSYLTDELGNVIGDVVKENKIIRPVNDAFNFFKGMFIFELTKETTIQHNFQFNTGNQTSKPQRVRTNFVISILKTS
ncbi:hypothetical protein [Bergeyella porcorum]